MVKKILKDLIRCLGIKAPWVIKLFLWLVNPIPRMFIVMAQWSGFPQAVTQKIWKIRRGPLKGYRLFNLFPLEVEPVLANEMEIQCSRLLLKLDLRSAVVFDLGASYGYYSLLLARLVKNGRVYCFEPDWRSFGRLVQNLEINAVQNVVPVPICISNSQPTLLKWSSRQADPWNSGLASNQDHSAQEELTAVPVMSLDKYSEVLNIQNRVRFIKIDVEGAELEVLKGAVDLLDSAQPLILCELHSGEIAQQVFEFLDTRHYEWEMVEYQSETRQHILAFPVGQATNYRAVMAK